MIRDFQGEYRFLSNFYPSPIKTPDLGTFPTVEHYYQAAKAFMTGNGQKTAEIRDAKTAGEAKRLGRTLSMTKEERERWEATKVGFMRSALIRKFPLGSPLAEKLLATGEEELVEGNYWHDTIWGKCTCPSRGHKDTGQNLLGKLLMEVRADLRKEKEALDRSPEEQDADEKRRRYLVSRAAKAPLRQVLQIDCWEQDGPDSCFTPDEDGDVICGGYRGELRNSDIPVRVQILDGVPEEVAIRKLRKILEWLEKDFNGLLTLRPERLAAEK